MSIYVLSEIHLAVDPPPIRGKGSRLRRGFRESFDLRVLTGRRYRQTGRMMVWQKSGNICIRAKMTWVRSATSAYRTRGFFWR